jgi:glutamate 5-kinase
MEILDAQKIVIKVGSSTIYDSQTRRVKFDWLLNFAKEILALQERNIIPVIFCSGAIAAGSDVLPEINHLEATTQKKIKGAVGQLSISNAWIAALSKYNIACVPLVISPADMEQFDVQHTIETLTDLRIVPVINENIPFQEQFDNDLLALNVAKMIQADFFFILTDTDGVYTENPKLNPGAKQIPFIDSFDENEMKFNVPETTLGSGGMSSKVKSALDGARFGITTAIINGNSEQPIKDALEQKRPFTLVKGSNVNVL